MQDWVLRRGGLKDLKLLFEHSCLLARMDG